MAQVEQPLAEVTPVAAQALAQAPRAPSSEVLHPPPPEESSEESYYRRRSEKREKKKKKRKRTETRASGKGGAGLPLGVKVEGGGVHGGGEGWGRGQEHRWGGK